MRLNTTQKKILKLLTINSRFTNQDIAKAANTSPDTVKYQIDKLIHKEKLGSFFNQFDYRLVGFAHYHYLIRFKDPEKTNLTALTELKGLTFINSAYGKYDLQLIVVARNEPELERTLKQIHKILGQNTQDFLLLKYAEQYKYSTLLPDHHIPCKLPKNQKSITYSISKECFASPYTEDTINLDQLDKKIIKHLIDNPRASYLELAKHTNTSHETIRNRMTRYIKKKLLTHFGLFNDFSKYGYFANFLLLKVKDFNESHFKEFINQKHHIFYAAKLIGDYNMIIYIVSKTPDEFGNHAKEIRNYFKDNLINIELLYFDKLLKNRQFPEELLQ